MLDKNRSAEKQPPTTGDVLSTAPGEPSKRSGRPVRRGRAAAGKGSPKTGARTSRRAGSRNTTRGEEAEGRTPAEPAATPAVAGVTARRRLAARKGGTARKKRSMRSVLRGRASELEAIPEPPDQTSVPVVSAEAPAIPASNSEQGPGVGAPSPGEHEETARLAYSYWEARGHQGGSAEEDWFRAQAEIRRRNESAKETRPRARARKAKT